jgi:FixJ family two-component response regulator
MNTKPTVFVVDDDASVRRSLRRLIESVGLPVECYESAQEFLSGHDAQRGGCLVLDVRMPGLSGLDLQQMLVDKGAAVPIVFITGHGDVPMTARAMKAGAVDFIEKPFNDQVLLDAIGRALERDAQAREARAHQAEVARRLSTLTARERDVMLLVVSGMMNKEVAGELGISEKTVKVHRSRVMAKTQADSLAELVMLAQTAGLCRTKVAAESPATEGAGLEGNQDSEMGNDLRGPQGP